MRRITTLLLAVGGAVLCRADDGLFDRVTDALSFTSPDHEVRLKLSGTVDLEGYRFEDIAPGLIYTGERSLLNPRVTLFLDAQFGAQVYGFAQARADRGFDPGSRKRASRLDEYAIRYTPWQDGRLSVQVGKFSTVVGNWVGRHLSWDNPFIGAPLPYENLTAIWDTMPPESITTLRTWAHILPSPFRAEEYADKTLRIPIIWGPSYATGAAISGRSGKIEYAAEVKNASISSRPEMWDVNNHAWGSPTFSARLGLRPNQMWNLGASFSEGSYLEPRATPLIPRGYDMSDYRQIVFAQDISFAWHHLQLWAEGFESRFEIPRLGNADVTAYYIEAKYKFTPQVFGAIRWNEELFRSLRLPTGQRFSWGRDVLRLDLAVTYRLNVATQLKVQYSIQDEHGSSHGENVFAAQLTLRF